MSYPFYLGYLHVCPQSMKREGVEVEYSRPGWGEDWPTTGHNVNAIIQRVVSAKQSDWTKVRSSHGDNSPSLTAYHQETWGSVTSSGLWTSYLLQHFCCILTVFSLRLPFLPLPFLPGGGTLKPGQHMCLITSFELRIRPWSVLLT